MHLTQEVFEVISIKICSILKFLHVAIVPYVIIYANTMSRTNFIQQTTNTAGSVLHSNYTL